MPIELTANRSISPSIMPTNEKPDPILRLDKPNGRELKLSHQPLLASTEEDVIKGDDETCVYLLRGITPTQRKSMSLDVIQGSHIGLVNMHPGGLKLEATPERPSEEEVRAYVNQVRTELSDGLIEFTTSEAIAKMFASESLLGYVLTIEIQKKFLTKGSVSESGWIAKQCAPYSIVGAFECYTNNQKWSTITSEAFEAAVKKEEAAKEYLQYKKNPEDFSNKRDRVLEIIKFIREDYKNEISPAQHQLIN